MHLSKSAIAKLLVGFSFDTGSLSDDFIILIIKVYIYFIELWRNRLVQLSLLIQSDFFYWHFEVWLERGRTRPGARRRARHTVSGR